MFFFISSEMLGRPEVQVTSSVDCWQKKEIDRQIFERFNMQKNRRTDRHIRDSIGKKTQTKQKLKELYFFHRQVDRKDIESFAKEIDEYIDRQIKSTKEKRIFRQIEINQTGGGEPGYIDRQIYRQKDTYTKI